MTRKIVGLAGYAQTGKDTIGTILTSHRGYKRISFADNVREAVYRLNPRIEKRIFCDYDDDRFIYPTIQELVESIGWESAKTSFPEVRRLLQVMGTEVGRDMFGQTSWIDMAERQVKALPLSQAVVFTDVRFKNEADFVRKMGGKVVFVVRPGTGPVNDHASDRIDFAGDVKIENGGTLGELTDEVLRLDSIGWSS